MSDETTKLAHQDWMLFDLLADRAEATDIAKLHPDIVRKMASKLERWRSSCRASLRGKDY